MQFIFMKGVFMKGIKSIKERENLTAQTNDLMSWKHTITWIPDVHTMASCKMKSNKTEFKWLQKWCGMSPVVFVHLKTQLTNALKQTETGESKTQGLTHMARDEEDKARLILPRSSSTQAHHTAESSNTTHHEPQALYCNYTRLAPGFTWHQLVVWSILKTRSPHRGCWNGNAHVSHL